MYENEATQETAETETSGEPTDADLIAASLEAGGAEAVDVEQEAEQAAAGTTPKPAAVEVEAGDVTEPKIAAILRAREKAFAERQAATDDAADLRRRASEEAAQVIADARRRAAEDYEAEMQARRARFKESPTNAIRELGFQTDDMVDAVAREGTAEWKAMRALQQQLAETQAKAGTADKVREEFDSFRKQIETEKANEARRSVEHAFLTQHAAPEKTPYLHKRYDPEEIVEKAHALANQWAAAKIPFAHSDIAEYLEHQARVRIAGTPSQQVSGASGNAPKVKANGLRTLSAASGSERRASPRPMSDMSPDEERDALIEVARDARRTLKADT